MPKQVNDESKAQKKVTKVPKNPLVKPTIKSPESKVQEKVKKPKDMVSEEKERKEKKEKKEKQENQEKKDKKTAAETKEKKERKERKEKQEQKEKKIKEKKEKQAENTPKESDNTPKEKKQETTPTAEKKPEGTPKEKKPKKEKKSEETPQEVKEPETTPKEKKSDETPKKKKPRKEKQPENGANDSEEAPKEKKPKKEKKSESVGQEEKKSDDAPKQKKPRKPKTPKQQDGAQSTGNVLGQFALFKHFEGLMVAPLAPMNQKYELNLSIIPKYAQTLVQIQRVQGIFVNGTAGESISLTAKERKNILEAWMNTDEVKSGQLYVIAHIGTDTLPESIELAKHARTQKVQGICLMPPAFFRPSSPQHLAELIAEIAKTVSDTPFYYYHIPSMTNVRFPMKDTLIHANKLSSNVIGCKFTDSELGDLGLCAGLGFRMLIGADNMILPGFAAGAVGTIGIGYNLVGSLHREIYESYKKGDFRRAGELQEKSRQFHEVVSRNNIFFSYKFLTQKLLGLDLGPLRWPHKKYTNTDENKLLQELLQIPFLNSIDKLIDFVNGKF